MNGAPLLPQHGFPLRLVVPRWYGMASVKWLKSIEGIDYPFQGFQQRVYSFKKNEKDPSPLPVTLQKVRSLIEPPGIPHFLSRNRLLAPEETLLNGRAWSGEGHITRVEISFDNGNSFSDTTLLPPLSPYSWCEWQYKWTPAIGDYTVCVRATDSSNNTQPEVAPWNAHGYANNSWHKIHIQVQPIPNT
eukprot:TRINITY_DN1009_c0_g1_i3.p1 TRINITY_DN1009_c0_g1~~TRINITY_DN1009_c0_g1_i3.p1  ORF type:complete len:189 (-),score=36.87 TRINITY_DN1009_c0_g1_i3:88-654(-)